MPESKSIFDAAQAFHVSPPKMWPKFPGVKIINAEKIIKPALSNGSHVICDRFVGSTLAYQGYGRGLSLEKLNSLCDEACQSLYPSLNILLDVPVHTLESRKGIGIRDGLEASGTTFLDRVRKGYLELARKSPSKWTIVDGSKPIREVSMEIQGLLRPYIYG